MYQGSFTLAMELAQLERCVADGLELPDASGPGLSILDGTPRYPLSADDAKKYQKRIAELHGVVEQADLDAMAKRLDTQLAVGNYAAAGGPGQAVPGLDKIASDHFEQGWYSGPEYAAQLPAAKKLLADSLVGYTGAVWHPASA